jgi:membrane protein DedA with SNARE-associated domain
MAAGCNSLSRTSDWFVALIDAALMAAAEASRTYLGGSCMGEPCVRRLWYEILVASDHALAQECADKAARVLSAWPYGEWLARIAKRADVFPCTLCPFRGTCWP